VTQSFQVDPDQLSTHAAHTGQVHETTVTAADAAQQVTPGGFDNAYGVLCQFLGQCVDMAGQFAQNTIQKTSEAVSRTQQAVDQAGRTYLAEEEKVSELLRRLLGDLDHAKVPEVGGSTPGTRKQK
jgi:excreted virulence factor EspC (type VII ESX diderm)